MHKLLVLHLADLESLARANEAARLARENTIEALRAEFEAEKARALAEQEQWREAAQRKQLLFLRRFYPAHYVDEIARLKAEPVE